MPSCSHRIPGALLGLLLFFLGGVATQAQVGEESGGSVLPDIAGTTWVRTNAPPFAGEEGLHFEADGSLGLTGISAMSGLTWKRRKNALTIATNTTFRPQPEEAELFMVSNDGQRLVLSAKDDYLAGPWYRDDQAVGILRGQVSGAAPLSAGGGLHLELREMQANGQVGRLIAKQGLPLAAGDTPAPFRLYFSTKTIQAGATYVVGAVITQGREMRYFTAQPVAVQPGQPATVTIPLSPAR
jgi:hypothetical protein